MSAKKIHVTFSLALSSTHASRLLSRFVSCLARWQIPQLFMSTSPRSLSLRVVDLTSSSTSESRSVSDSVRRWRFCLARIHPLISMRGLISSGCISMPFISLIISSWILSVITSLWAHNSAQDLGWKGLSTDWTVIPFEWTVTFCDWTVVSGRAAELLALLLLLLELLLLLPLLLLLSCNFRVVGVEVGV